jgi:purine nucleoside permease
MVGFKGLLIVSVILFSGLSVFSQKNKKIKGGVSTDDEKKQKTLVTIGPELNLILPTDFGARPDKFYQDTMFKFYPNLGYRFGACLRFDFSKTYWLFTGISGADPQVASVGSAAWARWVVNGDELREIDDREIPKGWPYGLFAIGALQPNTLPSNPNSFGSVETVDELSMAYPLNQGLARWAYAMTKEIVIPDTPALQKQREAWVGFPNAQRPPFVLMGETLGSVRYWHGPGRSQWARDWVKLWTKGQGVFAMTNMESQSAARTMQTMSKLGFVDLQRVLVLRTASNPSSPPPGVEPLATIGDEEPGQVAAYEANYRVGVPVIHEILANWPKYELSIPASP